MENAKSNDNLLLIIWGFTVIAFVGSLFFSEIMGFVPCELCWFQRILMYPLVIIYGTAAVKRDLSIALPGFILAVIGMGVSIYHYLVQKLPALQETGETCGIIPCDTEYVNFFGFITIPFLAGIAFIAIVVLHVILWKQQKGEA